MKDRDGKQTRGFRQAVVGPSLLVELVGSCAEGLMTDVRLPTVIIVHPREKRSKCTVAWLREDPRFRFYKGPRRPEDLSGYVRLGLDGPELTAADAASGLLILDGTWRLADRMVPAVSEVPVRRLPPLITAYPRVSKIVDDPAGGLATIEALYAAWRLLGRDVTGLLDHYLWGTEFVRINASFWPS